MTIGRIDPETAVREGWARDQDNEVSLDGYNAFIDLDTSDGSGSFQVANSINGVSFSADSGGDGYVSKRLDLEVAGFRPLAADPATVTDGDVFFRSDTSALKTRINSITTDLPVLYSSVESNSESTTTAGPSAIQQKLRLTTSSLPAGDYRVSWSFTWRRSSTAGDARFRIEQDDTTEIWAMEIEPQDASSNQRNPASGFRIVTLTSGVSTFDLDFYNVANGTGVTVGISQARIEIWKVGN